MDTRNGRHPGHGSVPTFDPNMFTSRISDEEWAKISDEELLPAIESRDLRRSTRRAPFSRSSSPSRLWNRAHQTQRVCSKPNLENRHQWPRPSAGNARHRPGIYDFTEPFTSRAIVTSLITGCRVGFERIAEMGRRFGLGHAHRFEHPTGSRGYFPEPEKIKRAATAGCRGHGQPVHRARRDSGDAAANGGHDRGRRQRRQSTRTATRGPNRAADAFLRRGAVTPFRRASAQSTQAGPKESATRPGRHAPGRDSSRPRPLGWHRAESRGDGHASLWQDGNGAGHDPRR